MRFLGNPVVALIVALALGVASAFGFATNPVFGYLLLGLTALVSLVAVMEGWRGGWRLQWPLTKRPESMALDHPQADFQRDTLERLQQALYDLDRAVAGSHKNYRGPGDPDPEEVLEEARHRVEMYRVRIEDRDLSNHIESFCWAAELQANWQQTPESKKAKRYSLDRANERIGALLRALH